MAWYAYGFVRLANGSVVPAGHDFGPTLDRYALGDSLGVRGDSEGFAIGLVKGEEAKLAGGYDVFVLVEQRRIREPEQAHHLPGISFNEMRAANLFRR
jgi:hypothetical protein